MDYLPKLHSQGVEDLFDFSVNDEISYKKLLEACSVSIDPKLLFTTSTGIKNEHLSLRYDHSLSKSQNDLQGTINFFSAYKNLTLVQASDPRLWTYLTHSVYCQYMIERWPPNSTSIKDRYFLRRTNLEALSRNGISRLWWYGFLTFDGNRSNPWELTEVLHHTTDIAVQLTERGLGANRNIRTGVLEFLLENPTFYDDQKKVRELMKGINLVGGVKNLTFLPVRKIKELLYLVSKGIS